MGQFYSIRGKQLYIEDLGATHQPSILFIHGGPGGSGVTEFIEAQGTRLSADFRLIAPDQRGVWRSEAVAEDEDLSLDDIIEDFEAIRKQLGIHKWSLLGHSFGGYLAALYGQLYPESISAIVYECPSFSFALAERYLLEKAIAQLSMLGKADEALTYRKEYERGLEDQEVQPLLDKVFRDLGPHGSLVFWQDPQKDKSGKLFGSGGEIRARWQKSNYTRKRLLQDGRIHTLVFSETHPIQIPSLLLIGKFDPITCPEQIACFKRSTPDHEITEFAYSGHSIHSEEPEAFAGAIAQFCGSVIKVKE